MTQVREWDRVNHVDLHLDGDFNFLFSNRGQKHARTGEEFTIQDAINFNEKEENDMRSEADAERREYEFVTG
jgi:hypothetical protein